jgi:hypothetical protein
MERLTTAGLPGSRIPDPGSLIPIRYFFPP